MRALRRLPRAIPNVPSVAAAGTSLASATQLTERFSIVISGTGGVRSRPLDPDEDCIIRNQTAAVVRFYPDTAATRINDLAPGQPLEVSPNTPAYLKAETATQLFSIGSHG